ncbi:hypothetical protein JCM10914_6412 [Paenibacillus sp. JCM 10914]|nr:hypothetical protein JCM10914_6412 [Paenibacillus sp. JCM 10914]
MEQNRIRVHPNRDRRHRYFVSDHRIGQILIPGVTCGLPVGHQNDVPSLRLHLQHFIQCRGDGRIDIRSACARDRLNTAQHLFLVAQGLGRNDPPRLIVKRHDPNRILGPQQFDRTHSRLLSQFNLLPAHASGSVNDQNQSERRDLALTFEFHRDRERFFDRRLEISTHPEAIIAACHHKSDPETADRLFNHLHLLAADITARDVVENDAVVHRILRCFLRQHLRRNDFRADHAGFQSGRDIARCTFCPLDNQYAGRTFDSRESEGCIVGRRFIPVHEDLCPVTMQSRILGQAPHRKTILARRNIDAFSADLAIILVNPQFAARLERAVNQHLYVERFCLIQSIRHLDLFHRNILDLLLRRGQHVYRDSPVSQQSACGCHAPDILIAIRDEHDAGIARALEQTACEVQARFKPRKPSLE